MILLIIVTYLTPTRHEAMTLPPYFIEARPTDSAGGL